VGNDLAMFSCESGLSLSELRAQFGRSRFLAMPIAGTIGWTVAGIIGAFAPTPVAAISLFVIGGMIFFLGVAIGRLIGDDIIGGQKKTNALDQLFILTVVMANMTWAIAIPFFMIEPTSLPLSLGVLSGAMWVPLSWMIQHWVGLFHGISRTVLVVSAWFLFPSHRFVAIPAVIVFVYLISIAALVLRKAPATTNLDDV
jgi:hypothetical protein